MSAIREPGSRCIWHSGRPSCSMLTSMNGRPAGSTLDWRQLLVRDALTANASMSSSILSIKLRDSLIQSLLRGWSLNYDEHRVAVHFAEVPVVCQDTRERARRARLGFLKRSRHIRDILRVP